MKDLDGTSFGIGDPLTWELDDQTVIEVWGDDTPAGAWGQTDHDDFEDGSLDGWTPKNGTWAAVDIDAGGPQTELGLSNTLGAGYKNYIERGPVSSNFRITAKMFYTGGWFWSGQRGLYMQTSDARRIAFAYGHDFVNISWQDPATGADWHTDLATAGFSNHDFPVFWLRAIKVGPIATFEYWRTDPALGGAPTASSTCDLSTVGGGAYADFVASPLRIGGFSWGGGEVINTWTVEEQLAEQRDLFMAITPAGGARTVKRVYGSQGAATFLSDFVLGDDERLTDERVPLDGSVTLAKMAIDIATQAELDAAIAGVGGGGGTDTGIQSVPAVRLRHSANVVIPASTVTVIPWDTEDYDTDGMHSTTVNNGRIYATQTGLHNISWNGDFVNPVASGNDSLTVRKNGIDDTTRKFAYGNGSYGITRTVQMQLNAGDYIEIIAYLGSGGNTMQTPWSSFEVSLVASGQSVTPYSRVYHTADQIVPVGTAAVIAFTAEQTDNEGMHDPAVNNSRQTCTRAGKHLIFANVQVTGQGRIRLWKNQTETLDLYDTASDAVIAPSRVVLLAAADLSVGDYVEVQLINDAAGSNTVKGDANVFTSAFTMTRIGGDSGGISETSASFEDDGTGAADALLARWNAAGTLRYDGAGKIKPTDLTTKFPVPVGIQFTEGRTQFRFLASANSGYIEIRLRTGPTSYILLAVQPGTNTCWIEWFDGGVEVLHSSTAIPGHDTTEGAWMEVAVINNWVRWRYWNGPPEFTAPSIDYVRHLTGGDVAKFGPAVTKVPEIRWDPGHLNDRLDEYFAQAAPVPHLRRSWK